MTKIQTEDGLIDFNDSDQVERLKKYIDSLHNSRVGQCVISIQQRGQVRSIGLNDYYFGVVVKKIAAIMGESDQSDVHKYLSDMIIPHVKFTRPWDITTSNMSSEEMWEYVFWCRNFAMNFFKTYIPLPNECIRVYIEPRRRNR